MKVPNMATARELIGRALAALPEGKPLSPIAEAAYGDLTRHALEDADYHLRCQKPELAQVTLSALALILAPAREDARLSPAEVSRLVRVDALALVALAELGDETAARRWRGLTRWAASIRRPRPVQHNLLQESSHVR